MIHGLQNSQKDGVSGRRRSDTKKIAAGRDAAALFWPRRGSAYDAVDGAAPLGAGFVRPDLARAGGLDGEAEFLLERSGDSATDGL
jgi:hypothetical protein